MSYLSREADTQLFTFRWYDGGTSVAHVRPTIVFLPWGAGSLTEGTKIVANIDHGSSGCSSIFSKSYILG